MAVDTKVGVYLCSGCEIGEALNIDQLAKVASEEIKYRFVKIIHGFAAKKVLMKLKKILRVKN